MRAMHPIAVVVCAAALVVSACSSSATTAPAASTAPAAGATTAPAASTAPAAGATTAPAASTAPASPSSQVTLPASIVSAGQISFGADFTVAPLQYYDANHNQAGIDVDLCDAIAQHLGVKAVWVDSEFDNLIPAVQANRFDAICTEMFIKPARAAVIDFVPYMKTGQGMLAVIGNPKNIKTMDDICGLNAVVQLGSVEENTLRDQSTKCTTAGKPAVQVKTFTYTADAVTQLLNGRADLWMGDDPEVAYYQTKDPTQTVQVLAGIGPTDDGIGISKSNTQLTAAVAQALKAMNADGSYDQIMSKWGITADKIDLTTLP